MNFLVKYIKENHFAKAGILTSISFVGSVAAFFYAREWAISNRSKSMLAREKLNKKYGLDIYRYLDEEDLTPKEAKKESN